MRTLTIEKLSENVGAEILDVDVDRLLHDEDLPGACLDALEQYGVLLFRELHADDDAQVEFGRKLGPLRAFPHLPPAAEEVMEISFDPANGNAEYLAANVFWHIDGLTDEVASKASMLSARVTSRRRRRDRVRQHVRRVRRALRRREGAIGRSSRRLHLRSHPAPVLSESDTGTAGRVVVADSEGAPPGLGTRFGTALAGDRCIRIAHRGDGLR